MYTEILLMIIAGLCLLILILEIRRTFSARDWDRLKEQLAASEDQIADMVGERIGTIRTDIGGWLAHDAEENRRNRQEVSEMIRQGSADQQRSLQRLSLSQQEALDRFAERQQRALRESLQELQETNRQKLEEIQTGINEKLESSLNQRLEDSFRTVGEQLSRLYTSLGELGKLEDGVNSLNRTLSNVKTRGILGEAQLENILASILSNTLYEKNVVTKRNSRDPVEFAVKIPDKEVQGSFMYLPIDSKFPTSIYDRIAEASEAGDSEGLQRAQRELEQRIRTEAKAISEKYIDPPATTDFALMFLPTESLYAEVLRISGLTEECQRKYHIVITGPTTIAALLNSLSIGFRYMAVNRDSQNILKLLSAIKSQYGNLSQLIETAGRRLDLARQATSDLKRRTELINRRLSAVEEIDASEAKELLGMGPVGEESADTVSEEDRLDNSAGV